MIVVGNNGYTEGYMDQSMDQNPYIFVDVKHLSMTRLCGNTTMNGLEILGGLVVELASHVYISWLWRRMQFIVCGY